MNLPTLNPYNQFVGQSNESIANTDDSLNSLGQIIESIQLFNHEFSTYHPVFSLFRLFHCLTLNDCF